MSSASNPCSNDCGASVAERRQSQTGTHWCPKPACQAAKQRYFRKRRLGQVEKTFIEEAASFVAVLATGRRMDCGQCGAVDCIPGYAHPDPRTAGAPCMALGSGGAGIIPLLSAAYSVERS